MIELKKLIRTTEIPELYDSSKFQHNTRISKLYHLLKPNIYELEMNNYDGSYSSFENSPISKGEFQFDLWKMSPISKVDNVKLDWNELKNDIKTHGMRNSLLLAPMPTASTSQILGNNECIEPFTSNIYSRSTLAGQFLVINKYLQDILLRINLWNSDLKDKIILDNGSIQKIEEIPKSIKEIYKISWELSMKSLIDQAAERGIYVCQSQSLNLWVKNPDVNKLSSMHMYAYHKGLKTGIYYLRRRSVAQAQNFSIDPEKEECLMCSS
jgi:ribonucleoside-diphosphate reductase alpha chain